VGRGVVAYSYGVMNRRRRQIVTSLSGALAAVAFGGGSWLVANCRQRSTKYVSAFGDKLGEKVVAASFFQSPFGDYTYNVSEPIAWAPHSFFRVGSQYIGVEKGPHLGFFDVQTMRLTATIEAPAGFYFYGHGSVLKFGNEDRFIVSGYQPLPGSKDELAGKSGSLFEYRIGPKISLQKIHSVDGYLPHHFVFSLEPSRHPRLIYNLTSSAAGTPSLHFCDAKTLEKQNSIVIGHPREGRTRLATHLLASKQGLYYAFNEKRDSVLEGGGIGFVDWNDLTKPQWEESYSHLLVDSFARLPPKALDLCFFNEKPTVCISATGSLMALELTKREFSELRPANLYGASGMTGYESLMATSDRGLVKVEVDGSSRTLAEFPAGFPDPKSHLCAIS
jgi:hypothetical protein